MGENPDELGKFTFAHARAGKGAGRENGLY